MDGIYQHDDDDSGGGGSSDGAGASGDIEYEIIVWQIQFKCIQILALKQQL